MEYLERTAKWSAIATVCVLPISTTVTLILFLLTSALVICSGHWRKKIEIIRSNPIALFMLAFFALFLICTTYSVANTHELYKTLLKFSWLLLTPLWMPLFVDKKWRGRAINAFLIIMTLTLCLSYLKYHDWTFIPQDFWTLLGKRYATTTTEIFKDHLVQGFLMAIAANVFLYRFLQNKKWFYAVLAVMAAINILLMGKGRTGYIIMLALLCYALFSQLGIKKGIIYFTLLIAGFFATLLFVPSPAQLRTQIAVQNIRQFQKGQEATSLGYRYVWMKNALILIKARPLLGYGTGGIKAAYASLPEKYTKQTGLVENVSNAYLNVALQFGLVGLAFFLIMLFTMWRYSFYLPKDVKFLFQTTLIAFCVGNLANSWMMDFTQAHFYAIFTILSFAALPKPVRAKDPAYNDDVSADIPA